jgi:hypothetical protein
MEQTAPLGAARRSIGRGDLVLASARTGAAPQRGVLRTGWGRADGKRAYPGGAMARKKKVRGRWGVWRFKGVTFVLSGPHQYEFDFDRCHDSAGILDQILQIYTLGYLKDKDVRDLLKAIDAILDPQAHYCSSGKNKKADPRAIARSRGYRDVAARRPRYTTSLAIAIQRSAARRRRRGGGTTVR